MIYRILCQAILLYCVVVHSDGSLDVATQPDSSFKVSARRSRDSHAWAEVDMTSSLDDTFADVRRTLKHASKFRRVALDVKDAYRRHAAR